MRYTRRMMALVAALLLFVSQGSAASVAWGSRGDQVRLVQQKLRQYGYMDGAADGVFGKETYDAVVWFQRKNGLTVDGVFVALGHIPQNNAFTALIESFDTELLRPSVLLPQVMEKTGYMDMLRAGGEAMKSDIDNLNQTTGAVTLMTLHSAKGLEFDVVFLAGMEEGVFPLSRATFEETQLEEERRLAYVGITRAKKRLFMSHARTRMLYNARNANELSRFVGEIPPRLIQDGAARAQTRIPRPAARSSEYGGYGQSSYGQSNYSQNSYAQRSPSYAKPQAGASGLNIPGIQKGAAVRTPAPAPQRALQMFKVGDMVYHAVFGRGRITKVSGEGSAQKVCVAFPDRPEKQFSANIAPLKKLN